MLKEIIGDYDQFLDTIFLSLAEKKIDVKNYFLDHLCYRVATLEEYESNKQNLLEFGTLLVEAPVNGRPIATFKFHKPIVYQGREIYLIELPSPKKGTNYTTCLEHVEFVIDSSFQALLDKYPEIEFNTQNIDNMANPDIKIAFDNGLTVKFHIETLETIIEKEKALISEK